MARDEECDKLSQDAAAARAVGLSYGKYKGLQYERGEQRIDPTREKVPANVKVCPMCGALFLARRKQERYCSDLCRANVHAAGEAERRRRAKEQTEK